MERDDWDVEVVNCSGNGDLKPTVKKYLNKGWDLQAMSATGRGDERNFALVFTKEKVDSVVERELLGVKR